MKTKIICAMALGLSMTASAAAAQDDITVNINSSVPKFCEQLGGLGTGPLALGALTSSATGQVVDTFSGTTSTSMATYYCNGPATISLQALPLVETSNNLPLNDSSSFTDEVHYLASLSWGAGATLFTMSDDSVDPAATVLPSGGARTGQLTISVSDPDTQGNLRPVAGSYEGSVVLNINFN